MRPVRHHLDPAATARRRDRHHQPAAETPRPHPGRHHQPGRHTRMARPTPHPRPAQPARHRQTAAHPPGTRHLAPPRATGYLRDLLISCSALPPADKQLRDYQAWLDRRLTSLASHPHLRILRQFGTWHQLPAMRARAAAGPLRATASQYARTRFTQAETFLTWAAGHGLHPAALTQADIDTYYATHLAHQRQAARAFLTWAASHGHIPHHLDIPRQAPSTGHAITQQRRLELLRRFATSTTIPIRPRTAACLLLLYAQPLSRILTLTTTDLTSDENGHSWCTSATAQPRPATVRHTAAPARRHPPRPHPRQPHQQLAVPRPQRRPARHLPGHAHPAPQPRPALRTARISALRQLVLQVPAPVIADALGFHHTTTTRQHINAGGPWPLRQATATPARNPLPAMPSQHLAPSWNRASRCPSVTAMTTRPFEIICEIEPPTRPDLTHARHQIGVLSAITGTFLIPDNHIGRATVSSIAVAHEVPGHGRAQIACINSRDRNLLGFRRDLLTAAAYGVGAVPVRRPRQARLGRADQRTDRPLHDRRSPHQHRSQTPPSPECPPLADRRRRRRCAPCPGGSKPRTSSSPQVSYSAEAQLRWRGANPVDVPVYALASWSSPARPWPGAWPPPSPTSQIPGWAHQQSRSRQDGRR